MDTALINRIFFPKGKIDWIDFKTNQLSIFFRQLSNIAKKYNFSFGLQFSSFFSNTIEYSGFYEHTSILLNSANFTITDETISEKPLFKFAADFSRSLAKFVSYETGRRVGFATETNWPWNDNFDDITLPKHWRELLVTFKNKGASALFVSHLGTEVFLYVALKFISGAYKDSYDIWRIALANAKNDAFIKPAYIFAFHLSYEQAMNYRLTGNYKYPPFNRGFNLNNLGKIDSSKDSYFVSFPFLEFTKSTTRSIC